MHNRMLYFATLMTVAVVETACAAVPEPRGPEDLITYVRAAEKIEIRESWGEEAGECFTWADYEAFEHANRPALVAQQLKVTPQFRKLVEMIKAMPQDDRDKLFARAKETARPTWAMMGRISREGTTDAGRKAGLEIARAIVGAVQDLLAAR